METEESRKLIKDELFVYSTELQKVKFYSLFYKKYKKKLKQIDIALKDKIEELFSGTTLRAKQLYTKLFLLYKYTKNERKTAFIKTKLEKFLNQTATHEEK
ncbi:hypothetical protein FMM05_13210 [Flavobacterium zepuense]|uniref:Uncharacterized protein n=1 Tax=Flavobacterium zepuense TaxID=2593302 RepID=A0A552UZG3_9FLAO|nr:hypothetical protein [Flavobacterium zepuense]TRW23614.1 hypothetical protein FMM05_13210 [Flavobacterium zepuense]